MNIFKFRFFLLSLFLHLTILAFLFVDFKKQKSEIPGGIDAKFGEFNEILLLEKLPQGKMQEFAINQIKAQKTQQNENISKQKNENQENLALSKIEEKNANLKLKKAEKIAQKKLEKSEISKQSGKNSNINGEQNQKTKNENLSAPNAKLGQNLQSVAIGANSASVQSYQGLIFAHLNKYKKYPQAALIAKNEGSAKVSVELNENGKILSANLIKSTKFDILNDEILELFKRASPLPKPPKELIKDKRKIKFTLNIDYNIKKFYAEQKNK